LKLGPGGYINLQDVVGDQFLSNLARIS
jgi:hypothetical protein